MFEVGERVVCVDDRPADILRGNQVVRRIPVPLFRGRVYTVRGVIPAGSVYKSHHGGPTTTLGDAISVGVARPDGHDGYHVRRFRKLRKLSTKESLKALIGLTDKTPEQVR